MGVAVIAGDLALSGAFRLMDRTHADTETRDRLLALLDDAIFASAAGELIDIDFSLYSGVPSVDDIVHMERLKTAVYSFEAPLQAGAMLAGATPEIVAALGEFGRNIGIAYQIVDDLLGVFGNEESTGKTTLGDLREGKRTAIIAFAAESPEWASLQHQVGKPDLTHAEADTVKASLEAIGARRFTEQLAANFADKAVVALAGDCIPSELRERLQPIIATVLERVR